MTRWLTRPVATLFSTVLLGATVVGGCSAGLSVDDGAAGRPLLVGDECADLVVFGARGSMQDPRPNLGVGTEVRAAIEQLARRLHARSDTTLHVEAIGYDSSATPTAAEFLRHTADGSSMALDHLTSRAAQCPDSRFALLGFSQGAHVVHTAAMSIPVALASRVVLVGMIADPTTNPGDTITQWSYADHPTPGHGRLGAGPAIPPALRHAAISFCVAGDAICNDRGAPGDGQSPTHKHFYEKTSTARITATQLDLVLQRNGV